MELNDKVSSLKGIGPKKAEILKKNHIFTLEDLLNLFPRKYEDRRQETRIEDLQPGKEFLISGKVLSRRYSGNPYKKNTPLTLLVSDETGTVEILFFNEKGI